MTTTATTTHKHNNQIVHMREGRKTVAAAMAPTTMYPLTGLLSSPSCLMPMLAETKLLSRTKAMVARWERQRQQ